VSKPESVITVSIRETETSGKPVFLFHVLVDGEVVASNQSLSPAQSKAVREFSRRYNSLFEQHKKATLASEDLSALGAELFELWLAQVWEQVAARVPLGARRLLVVASDVPDVLNLPWELLRPADGDFMGSDAKFSIRRLPWWDRQLAPSAGQLRPRPLRILFMACAPQDQPSLDYEREEESLLKAIGCAGPDVAFDSGDLGSFDELRQRINDFKPHIVHLTGHGIVAEDGRGYFAFEDERGQSDLRSSVEIGQLFAGSEVQCAFISGCQTGKAPPVAALGGICQGLVGEEVPLAIGWAASIADVTATNLAAIFYDAVADGETVDRALTQARQGVRKECDDRGDPSWTLPTLYAATGQGLLFDTNPKRPAEPPPRQGGVQQPLAGMVEGYAEHFVGRRRELQRLLPALRDGTLQTVVTTGLGGAGKSALATRLARRLEADAFTAIPVPSTQQTPLSATRLLEICGDIFLKADLRKEHDVLGDASLSVTDRLHYVVNTLNEGRFVLVLDNFEVNMDEPTLRILDADLAGLYAHLLTHLTGGSRAIITCRYLPADVSTLPPKVHEEPLGDFPEAAFLKFLLRDELVEQRYYRGELPHDLLRKLHGLLGSTPRFLLQIRQVLKTMTAAELERELDTVKVPSKAEPSVLREARDRYCEEIFTARLYGYLGPDSQRALSRAAVYGVPINFAGLEAVTGLSADALRGFARQWQDYSLAHPEQERADGGLWTVYGLLRGWLLAPERMNPEERRAAHLAAGDFLRDLEGQDREGELGLSWGDCLLEARGQYLAAEENEQARTVTGRISGFLARRGLYGEVVRLNQDLLCHEEHANPANWVGQGYLAQGHYGEARKWYERGLKAAGAAAPAETARAWHGLGTIDVCKGEYGAAREKFRKSLETWQEMGDRGLEATALNQLATIDVYEGQYGAAREKFQESLKIKQEVGDPRGEAATWHNLATIDMHQGDYEAAREKYQKSLEIEQQIGNRAGEAATWHQLATVDIHQDEYGAAREKLQKSLETYQQIGDQAGEAAAWHQMASIDGEEEDYGAAREKFEKSLEIKQRIGDRAGEAATWHQLATVDLKQRDYGGALEKFQRSLEIKQQIGHPYGEAATWSQLGALAAELGRPAKGVRLVAICFLIDRSIGHGDTEKDFQILSAMASELDYSQEQIDELLRQVAESYQADQGRRLLQEAFGEG
jgi:tetratricopeptide (TPR) repeat protein